MSRHRVKVARFGLKTGPRNSLMRGLVGSLIEHGRIKTTLAKAKELRRHVEPAVTLGKKGTLHARRILMSRYPNEKVVSMLMTDIAPRFKDREGGYTRVLKLGLRPGDAAEMAFIEFVDYAPKSASATTADAATGKKKTKKVAAETDEAQETAKAHAASKVLKTAGRLAAAKKKRIRKAKEASRRTSRQ